MSETKATWVTAKPEEIKAKIIELAKQGMPAEKIGLVLRDQEGIPRAKLLGIKVSKILRDTKAYNDSETINTDKKIEVLQKHSAKHKHDYKAARSLTKNTAKSTARKNLLKR
jgi:small subunit ribosomal protein S15